MTDALRALNARFIHNFITNDVPSHDAILHGDFICITPMGALEGKAVTTIEGLAAAGREHPLQAAWKTHNVPQCGYCQSGQIMTAAALLAKTANPTDADIDEAMRNNICRCGTYQSIRRAVHLAAELRAKGGVK